MLNRFFLQFPIISPNRDLSLISDSSSFWMKTSYRQSFITGMGLFILFLLSFEIRYWAWYFEPVIARDGVFYLELIQHWPDIQVPPLFPGLVWRLTQCGLNAHDAAWGLNIFCGAMLPVIFYFILMNLCSDRCTAWCGACLIMLHPQLVETSYMIIRDSLYLFFLAGFWLFGIRAFRNKPHTWTGAGICCILACFTRYESFELLLLFIIAMLSVISLKKSYNYAFKSTGWFITGNAFGILLSIIIINASWVDYYRFWRQILTRFIL